jgi:pre-mRNA-processing factor SLU7
MTHKAKDCCEKPRKIGAKFNPKDIAPDEVIKELRLDFDGTRDRWNGYDPEEYGKIVERKPIFSA